jgi:hypothetical protein
MTPRRKPQGHPAKQDPATDQLFRTMRSTVELVQTLQPRLTPEADVNLRAAALAMMTVYAELAGLPSPTDILTKEAE